jgi:hypothetical protein
MLEKAGRRAPMPQKLFKNEAMRRQNEACSRQGLQPARRGGATRAQQSYAKRSSFK